MPRYEKYTGRNAAFINPYNFVSVDFKKSFSEKRENAEEIKGCRSGVLKCAAVARTPIAIPETSEQVLMGNGEKHKGYYFMRTPDGRPMIPGSSLRGVIRSIYETVTDSCFVTSDETKSITYRTKNAFKSGLLYKDINGDFQLFDAERYIFAVDCTPMAYKKDGSPIYKYVPYNDNTILHINEAQLANYSYGQHVFFYPGSGEKRKGKYLVGKYIQRIGTGNIKLRGMLEGFICIGEPFSAKKHFESVFVKKNQVAIPNINVSNNPLNKAVRDLEEIIKIYNDETVNINAKKGAKFYRGRDYIIIENDTYLPVWYKIDTSNNSVYLSVASIGRSAYKNTMGDMLGEHVKCTSREKACPACRLFGMVGEKSMGTRVRISDAYMKEAQPRCRERELIPLKELAGPKISYLPFYLRNTGNTKESWSYDSNTTELAGRKYYWHNTKREAHKENDRYKSMGDRNSSVELMGAGSVFEFEVYYNQLTEKELDQLIWTLSLGDNNENSNYCYKIGHGKPIGLGSVKIIIQSGSERKFDNEGYSISPLSVNVKSESDLSFDMAAVADLKQISDINACKLPVTYPAVVDDRGVIYNDSRNNHASHQWFSNNYSFGNTPNKVLPSIGKQNNTNDALQYIKESPNKYGNRWH